MGFGVFKDTCFDVPSPFPPHTPFRPFSCPRNASTDMLITTFGFIHRHPPCNLTTTFLTFLTRG